MATNPAEFTIDQTKATPGPMSVSIEGPQQAKVNCTDSGKKTCAVSYVPPVPGVYTINVLYDGKKHIKGSPFMVQAYPVEKMDLNVDKVKAYGPGLQPNGVSTFTGMQLPHFSVRRMLQQSLKLLLIY